MIDIFLGGFEQGFLYALVTFGVLISFRILDFPDLTVDGSFTLGAAVMAIGVFNGYNPFLFTFFAILAGSIAGMVTAVLHTKLGINKIVSGLITMTILYSINLVIMGKSNLSLLRKTVIFDTFKFLNLPQNIIPLIVFTILILVVKLLLDVFFKTEFGTLLRALGNNEQFILTLGISPKRLKIIGLAVSNALVAFSGSLAAQNMGFADVNMGFGVLVIGFASLVIGETVIRSRKMIHLTIGSIIGTCIYFSIVSMAIRMGMNPSLFKLITGLIIIFVLALSQKRYRK